ncbi:MAG: hypothetical protein AAFO81_03790, partial [Pseudomonadota bacterium]
MTPTVVLGATGYVGAEFLRLIAAHPHLRLHAAVSGSAAGKPVGESFPHLRDAVGALNFCTLEDALQGLSGGTVAIFSALPHGSCARVVADVIARCEQAGLTPRVVDASADFRFREQAAYEAIYHGTHGAAHLLNAFDSAVPELLAQTDATH